MGASTDETKVYRVTQAQHDSIESAWALCAYPGKRRITRPGFTSAFEEVVTEVLGEAPLWPFTLEIDNGN
jgi:hypothetical protein